MEEQLKELNKTLNKMITTEDRFTEKHRNNIRERIAKKRSGRFSMITSNWKPIVSTAVSLVLLFVIAQLLFNNLSTNSSQSSAGDSAGADKAMTSEAQLDENANFSGDAPAIAEEKLDKANKVSDNQSPPLEHDVDAVIQNPALPLDNELKAVYEELKATQSQKALADLGAFQVMQLYFYASENFDYETEYMMYYQDPAGARISKKMFVDDMKNDPSNKENTEKLIQDLKEVKRFEISYRMDDPKYQVAYITWGGTGEDMKFFRLIRDQQKDVWTVSFVPMQ